MINELKRQEIDLIRNNEEVRKYFNSIKVFGSAITDKCKEESDIDLYVDLKLEYLSEINKTYNLLMSLGNSDKDILYKHEQVNCPNKKLIENMEKGLEIL